MHGDAFSDETKIRRGLLTAGLILGSVFLAWLGLTRGIIFLGLLIPVVAIAVNFIEKPTWLFLFIYFVSAAQLRLPGLPGVLSISCLSMILLIGWALLDVSVLHKKRTKSYRPSVDLWLGLFIINLVLIISVRGFGFAMAGSYLFGGGIYAQVFLVLFLFFAMVRVRWVERDVRLFLWAILIGCLLSVGVEILNIRFGGAGRWISNFIGPESSKGAEMAAFGQEQEMVRWSSFRPLAVALVPAGFVLFKNKMIQIAMMFLAVIAVGLTGYRSITVQIAVIIFFCSMYFSMDRKRTFFLWVATGAIGLVALFFIAPTLPLSMQRTISFIPYLPVDIDVAEGAASTIDWRVSLWKDYCVPNIDRYLFIGRGLARDVTSFAWLRSAWYDSPAFFYHMGRYHSGPFSLLLDYGLLGIVSFTMFFFLSIREGWATIRHYVGRPYSLMERYYVYLTILLTYELLAFFLVFGDVDLQLFQFLGIVAQMRIMKVAFMNQTEATSASPRSGHNE